MCTGLEIAMAIGGLATQALGQIQAGKAAKASGQYNAAVQRNQAIIAKNKAAFDAERARELHIARLSATSAAFAKGGVTVEGTPLMVLEEAAQQQNVDIQAIIYGGDIQATGYESQAELDRMEGEQAEKAGYLAAGSTLLTKGGGIYKAYKEG